MITVVWRQNARDRNQLRRPLAEHERSVWPRCRYLLSTLDPSENADRCPECATVNDPARIEKMWRKWEESLKMRAE